MPRDGATLASYSGDEDWDVFDSSAPKVYSSASRAVQRRAALSPWIDDPRARRQLQDSSRNDVRRWKEGKSMIFDDSNEHEVWNDTDCYRVVLFVDFVRATIFPLSIVNRSIIWARGRYPL